MDDEICTIKWTVEDVRQAYIDRFHREPTNEELDECVLRVNAKALKDASIEYGWQFIHEAIR